MNPEKIARKRFMMFSCSIISREENIKSRHESKNQKVFKSDFKEVLYSTLKSCIAKYILPIVNPDMFTIARFFGLKCLHIGYSNILSFVGIKKVGQLFLLAN